MGTLLKIGNSDYKSDHDGGSPHLGGGGVHAQPQMFGTAVRLTSTDFSREPTAADFLGLKPTPVENTTHDHGSRKLHAHDGALQGNLGMGIPPSPSSRSTASSWTPAVHPDAPARLNPNHHRHQRAIPQDLNAWFLHQLGYAIDWTRKCAKRRRERVGDRELATVPCYEWCTDANASRQSCSNVAACLAAALSEWEPLPQEFINSRAKSLSDVSALTRKTQMFLRDVEAHGKQWPTMVPIICERFRDAIDKNKDQLRAQREILRTIASLHSDTMTAVMSNNDWQCGKLHATLGDVAAYYDATKRDVDAQFTEPSTDLRMQSRAIRRATDDLRTDVRESGVLTHATMAALDAVAESSSDGLNMDQMSYMRRELTNERDRLSRQTFTLGDERRDHEDMQRKLGDQFSNMNSELDMLHKRRAALADDKEQATDAQGIVRLEMDLRRIERQIGDLGTKMAENMRLAQWTREESSSRMNKQNLLTQWLGRLHDLERVLEDAVQVQNETASRHHDIMSVLDAEVKKTLTDLQKSQEDSAVEVENRVVKQLSLQIDALPAELQEATLAANSRRNVQEAVLAVSRRTVENPAMRTFKHDVDKLHSIVRELLEAQTLAAKMINFEEVLTTLKQMWSVVWAHDKKN